MVATYTSSNSYIGGHNMKETVNLERESQALSIPKIREVIDYLPYGNQIRVMFQFLAITGSRISELDRMRPDRILKSKGKYWLIWSLGKNQKSFRKEEIPEQLIQELRHCRVNRRCFPNRLFSMSHDTFRRVFNRDIRPHLSSEWMERKIKLSKGQLQTEYVLQLKGLRKTFQTLNFARELKKWNNPDIALEFTSKRMKHSSKHITAYHYIVNFDQINTNADDTDFLENTSQTHLTEYN